MNRGLLFLPIWCFIYHVSCRSSPKASLAFVELFFGDTISEGNVYPFNPRTKVFGPVCDDGWDSKSADVVCKQLGFANAKEVFTKSHFGDVPGVFAMDELSCTGDEDSLQQCRYEQTSVCRPGEAAGVVCRDEDRGVWNPAVAGPGRRLPPKVVAFHLLLADDTNTRFLTNTEWKPKLHGYQQKAANVLIFSFINPTTMDVPKSFQNLAATRGTGSEGSIPKDTTIIFGIGGTGNSPWHWLLSPSAAEAMARKVADWFDSYEVDGIELDIQENSGSTPSAGSNVVHFIKKLRELKPDVIVGLTTQGYPSVKYSVDVINESWSTSSVSHNVLDYIGILVYQGTESLNSVSNYAQGSTKYEGFPIKVNVPKDAILLGCKGSAKGDDIQTLASESVDQGLLGIMVWYASVVDGLRFDPGWDVTSSEESIHAFQAATTFLNPSIP